ncbi:uncharacterized protein [Dipodomys merriami]|uniref:uncharacterized protein isoform X2 n=1 Tax=Dipodomys merriami TaxID=94247 RepID=UPI0038560832
MWRKHNGRAREPPQRRGRGLRGAERSGRPRTRVPHPGQGGPRRARWQHALGLPVLSSHWTTEKQENGLLSPADLLDCQPGSARVCSLMEEIKVKLDMNKSRDRLAVSHIHPVFTLHAVPAPPVPQHTQVHAPSLPGTSACHGDSRTGTLSCRLSLPNYGATPLPTPSLPSPLSETLDCRGARSTSKSLASFFLSLAHPSL